MAIYLQVLSNFFLSRTTFLGNLILSTSTSRLGLSPASTWSEQTWLQLLNLLSGIFSVICRKGNPSMRKHLYMLNEVKETKVEDAEGTCHGTNASKYKGNSGIRQQDVLYATDILSHSMKSRIQEREFGMP